MADLCFAAIVILCAFIGKKRGFLRTFLSMGTTLVSTIAAAALVSPVSKLIMSSPLGEGINALVKNYLITNPPAETADNASALEKMGADAINEAALKTMSAVVTGIAAFVLAVLLIKLAIRLLFRLAGLAAKLPVIKQANSALGLITGLICGILTVYIAVGVIFALDKECVWLVTKSIKSSFLVSVFTYRNVISELL